MKRRRMRRRKRRKHGIYHEQQKEVRMYVSGERVVGSDA